MKTEVFIDISPAKNKRVCSNCLHWRRWGVATGLCNVNNKGRNRTQGYTCKYFDKLAYNLTEE